MNAITTRWDRFWFAPVPPERIAIFRIAVVLFALIDVAFVSNYMIHYTSVDRVFFDPVILLRITDSAILQSATVYAVMTAVLIAALSLALVGYRTRVALAISAPLYLYHWAFFNSWGKVNHGKIPVIFALFVLILAPCARRLSVDAWRRRKPVRPVQSPSLDFVSGWALKVVAVVLVCAYMFSVYSKLRNTGISWAWEPILLPRMQLGEGWAHDFLADQPTLLVAMQTVTFIAEALSILLLTGNRSIRNVLLVVLGGFHLSAYYLMETEFFGYLVCYLVFFRTERILEWFRIRCRQAIRALAEDPLKDPAGNV